MTLAGAVYVGATVVAFLLLVFVIWMGIKHRPVVPTDRVVGFIEGSTIDEDGVLKVTGVMTEEGMALVREGTITGLSLGFTTDEGLLDAAVVTKDPRPCQGGNSNICVAEGCYGEACRIWRPKKK